MNQNKGFYLGRRERFCSLPIACAILFLGFYNLLSSTGSILLVFLKFPSYTVHAFGTRILLLFRAALSILWGLCAIANVTIFKRQADLARFTLMVNAGQLLPWGALLIDSMVYIISDTAMPSLFAWGAVQAALIRFSSSLMEVIYPFGHYHFPSFAASWIEVAIFTMVELLYIFITLDISWSYYNVLFYGGSGWEYKSYQNLYGVDDEDYCAYYDETRRLV